MELQKESHTILLWTMRIITKKTKILETTSLHEGIGSFQHQTSSQKQTHKIV